MKYALLIYSTERDNPRPGTDEFDTELVSYAAFTDAIDTEGISLGGKALNSIATATSVRVRGSEVLVTDGPFAETKEQLGGFYLVECDDLDEAIAAAARIPSAVRGTIEIRPILDIE